MKKKFTAFILVISLVASFCFAGCGTKEVDYDIEGEENDTADTTGSGVLATNLGIPDFYEGELNVGDSGLSSITIDADNITVPEGDSMSYVTCVKNEFDSEYKKQICEAVFDKDEGIYVYDADHRLEEDLQAQIDYYEGLLASATALDDEEFCQIYREWIGELEDLMHGAVMELEAAGDYSADNYLGYINGQRFLLTFDDEECDEYGNIWSEFYLSYYPYENLINYRPYEDAEKISLGGAYGSGLDVEAENICEYSLDEATSKAMDFLGGIEIENVSLVQTGIVEWTYSDAVNNEITYEVDGYYLIFSRQINGDTAPVVNVTVQSTESTGSGASTSEHVYQTFNEEYVVSVDSNGVISARASFVLTEENEEQNADIISWDEVIKILNDGAGAYFTENKPTYNDVVFNDIRLTYLLIKDPDKTETYNYTPVWYFAQSSDDGEVVSVDGREASDTDNEYEELYPQAVIIINAMDGTIYDIDDVFSM